MVLSNAELGTEDLGDSLPSLTSTTLGCMQLPPRHMSLRVPSLQNTGRENKAGPMTSGAAVLD